MTPADGLVLSAACRVNVFGTRQAERLYARGGCRHPKAARRRLVKLAAGGLLGCTLAPARPDLELTTPLARWLPGRPAPDFDAWAWALEVRWQAPLGPTEVWYATRRAAGVMGGSARGELSNPQHLSHDLGVTAIYLALLVRHPALAAGWASEREVGADRSPGAENPDARIAGPGGEPLLFVEFGGGYGAGRLRRLHAFASDRSVPYEVW